MKVSLSTSLHLNHGEITPDLQRVGRLPMMEFVPVGLLALKAYADDRLTDVDVRVTELNGLINRGVIDNDEKFYENVVDVILEPDDDLVGLMTDADSLHHTVLIADRIRKRRPEVDICLGGPGSTAVSTRMLTTFPFIDYVVRGEGEQTFVQLLNAAQGRARLPEIAGLTWHDDGRVIENPARHVASDLDALPLPSFEAFDMLSGAPLYLDVGRGCPFRCRFCATAPFWHRLYRMKSIERIHEELCLVRDAYDRRSVNFSHDIFTCNRTWTLEFCDYLIQDPPGVSWTCSTRTDIIDREVLERMAEAGCVEIYYGIETGSPEMQERIDKNLDLDRAREVVGMTADVGIRPVTGFILGYPAETRETLSDTLRRFFEFLRVGGYRAHIFTLAPFPGAPMFAKHGVDALDRFAEYYELALKDDLLRESRALKREYPEIFASTYRFATPALPARLVDASEELSAGLSMLRSLWPRVLTWYESELEFYERWVDWIEKYNGVRRPGTDYPHQADAEDLLTFVEEEMERVLTAGEDPARDLVSYERLKLDARALGNVRGKSANVEGESEPADGRIDIDAAIERSDYLIREFKHDVGLLLGGGSAVPNGSTRRWVAVVKVDRDHVTTVTLGTRAKRVLDVADARERVRDLLGRLVQTDDNGDFDAYLRSVGDLVAAGLFTEVG